MNVTQVKGIDSFVELEAKIVVASPQLVYPWQAEHWLVWRVSERTATVQVRRGTAALDLLIFGTKFNPLKPSGYFVYRQV